MIQIKYTYETYTGNKEIERFTVNFDEIASIQPMSDKIPFSSRIGFKSSASINVFIPYEELIKLLGLEEL